MATMTRRYKTVTCPSCDVLVINNHICHEHGCPDAYRDETRECQWCGTSFQPDERDQRFCSEDCAQAYSS